MPSDFAIGRTLDVTSTIGEKTQIRLAPNDYCEGIAVVLDVYFCYGVPGHLDQERLIEAARLLLQSFPALGARLNMQGVQGVPSLDMTEIKIPVSFAAWPNGSIDQLFGVQNASKTLPPEIAVCDPIKVGEADALFKLRVTALGDGNTVLAASWLHILADGASLGRMMHWLATAYKNLGSKQPGKESLPVADPERPFWAWHLKGENKEDEELLKAAGVYHGLKEEINQAAFVEMAKAHPELLSGGPMSGVNVGISKANLKKLKEAVSDQPIVKSVPYISSNDIAMGIVWMLQNEAKGKPRPGQGPAEATTTGGMGVDLVRNGLPEHLNSPGLLTSFAAATPLVDKSDGSLQAEPNKRTNLLASLAHAAVAVRRGISVIQDTGAVDILIDRSYRLITSLLDPVPEVLMSTWTELGHEKVDFGHGTLGFYGHFGMKPTPVVLLPNGDGVILRFGSLPDKEATAILSSPVLKLISEEQAAFLVP